MYITKEQWKEIKEVLVKHKIPYTTWRDDEMDEIKHIQINLVMVDCFKEE